MRGRDVPLRPSSPFITLHRARLVVDRALRPRFVSIATAVAVSVVLGSCDSVEPILPVATTLTTGQASIGFASLGEEATLTVSVLDQEGNVMAGAALAWASQTPGVASVSSAGVVRAVANGETAIIASSGSASLRIPVRVAQVATTLTLSSDSARLTALGDTARLVATATDAGGSAVAGAVVTWFSLDASVATVTDGLVQAVAGGVTAVAASTTGLLATASIRVEQTSASVSLSADSVSMSALGDTTLLGATVVDPGGSPVPDAVVTWSSSDTLIVRVTGSGVAIAVGNGVAQVTATSGTASDQRPLTITQIATGVAVAPDSVVLGDLGATTSLSATAVDRRGAPVSMPAVTWSSSDGAVVTVDSIGSVTAVGTGTAAITATVGGVAGAATARVVPALTLEAAGPSQQSAEVATSVALSARVRDVAGPGYEGASVTWTVLTGSGTITSAAQSSSDANGFAAATWLLGTAAGPQTARASIESRGATVVTDFTATALPGPAVAAALLADSVLLSGVGETVFLGPTFADLYGNVTAPTAVNWVSSDPSVASIAPDGLVTGVGSGTTWLTAALRGPPTDSILVTLVPRGAITVTYDDGWLTTYTNAWPEMQALGLVGNVGVYTEAVDLGFGGYMNQSQLQELHDDGWTLVSHTVSHDSLSLLSDPVLDYELRTSQRWLVDRGFGRGSDIFIAPYHDFGLREKVATSGYYIAARGTSANIVVPDSMVTWQPGNPFELTGIDVEQLPYTTVAGRDQLRVMLQRTLDEGRFLDVLFHQVPPANVPDLIATLTIIADFRDRVLPYHQLYPDFARPIN